MCAKMAKKIQTDYTTGGHDISQTAIPLYQNSLNQLGNITNDINAYRQNLLNQYYGADAIQNQDFLRAYNRNMGQTTANNYAATTGGYTSSGQRAYDDQQRYYNDLASRLQQYGITGANNLTTSDISNLLNAQGGYQAAYQLGKDYSDIEQYNNAVRQANKNWLGQGLSALGSIGMASGNPIGMALGAAAGIGGNLMTTDVSGITGSATPNIYGDTFTNLGKADWGSVFNNAGNWWNKNISNRGLNVVGTDAFGRAMIAPKSGNGPIIRGRQ